jgi:hypothetical protein
VKSIVLVFALAATLAGVGAPLSLAEEEKAPAVPYLEIGKVKLFRAENRVEVSGVVTVARNLIELFACAEGGKAHESVLVIDCRPSNLNLALKLLGLDDGGQNTVERTVAVEEDGKKVEKRIKVVEENGPNYLGDPRSPVGDRVIVTVRWEVEGEMRSVRAEDMIYERARGRTMPRSGWIYVGSRFVNNPISKREEIGADHTKTLMTTWHDPDTLLDNPLPDGGDDEVYFANGDIVPPRGTRVVMEVRKPTKKEAKEAEKVAAAERKAAAKRKASRTEGEKK